MATQTIKMKIQFRRDTTENWFLSKDVVPAAGEPCFDLDAKTLKIGDGTTTYENLPIIGGSGISIDTDGTSIVLEDGIMKLAGFDAAKVGAQPRKTSDGKIEWVVPSIDSEIETLQEKVSVLENDVDFLHGILIPDEEGATTLEERVAALETDVDRVEGSIRGIVLNEVNAQINEFASKMSDDEIVNTFKELVDYVANHGGEVATIASDITYLKGLVGSESVQDQIDGALRTSGFIKEEALNPIKSVIEEFPGIYATKEELVAATKQAPYEITSTPKGTLVDYRDKEIRVMVPENATWIKQTVGANGNPDMYYMGFKAYAPKGAVYFKEGDRGVIIDELYDFNGDFAGTDEFGRNYSICWLALASYNKTNDTWTYYGKNSTTKKYVGWDYVVEWYDADKTVIGTDHIRINMSNEACHNAIEPYYGSKTLREVAINGTLLDVVDGRVNITIEDTLCVKGSDDIAVATDGTLTIKSISLDKIVQSEDSVIVMDGGGA